MTTVYFIRHAESDRKVRDGRVRPLTEKGMNDRRLVTNFLKDKNIDAVLSSPFKRAVDTVADFAEKYGFNIEIAEDFREQKSSSDLRSDDPLHYNYLRQQWSDFNYTITDGERIGEVQERNISALNDALTKYRDRNIVIGTHATALSTIIHYYDKSYGFDDFKAMEFILPWVVRVDFNDDGCIGMEKIDLFKPKQWSDNSGWWKVNTANLGDLKAYKYVVIFARYKNKWLYCRARTRDTFETAGGHIETGETTLEAAKRELYEETGAVKFDITSAFDYSVHRPNVYANGQVFWAHIHELSEMPDYEMAEIKLFDAIPDKMRFPQILPVLYERMQVWLNLQSAKDEIWDVYDSERKPTGRTHRRADPLPKGDFHLVVHVWLVNSHGEFLITKRAPNKGYPNMWECTGGSAVSGDDSIAAAIREIKEETGLNVLPENGSCVFTLTRDDSICDIWLFRQDFDIRNVVLQENETTDAKYASKEEIQQMIKNNEFIAFHYIEELFKKERENSMFFNVLIASIL